MIGKITKKIFEKNKLKNEYNIPMSKIYRNPIIFIYQHYFPSFIPKSYLNLAKFFYFAASFYDMTT